MKLYTASPKEFESWIIQMHPLYQMAFEQIYKLNEDEDLDLMLLKAMDAQASALETLRCMLEDYIKTGYLELTKDLVNSGALKNPQNNYLLRGFYSFLHTQGHSRPFAFQSLKWSENQMLFKNTPLAMYQDLREHFLSYQGQALGRIPPMHTEGKDWQSLLEFWGVHLATEIRNDSFDTEIVGKKLFDFIVTMACLYTLLGI